MLTQYYRLTGVLLVLLWIPTSLFAQQAKIEQAFHDGHLSLDQKLLYQLYSQQKPQKLPSVYAKEKPAPLKCGTPVFMELQRKKDQLSPSTVREIRLALEKSKPDHFKTYPSTSGTFLIHYTTTGEDAVPPDDQNNSGIPDYIELVAQAADSSYRHEVQTLGYTDPIQIQQPYHIEVLNLQYIYGRTYTDKQTTVIQIENDFAEDFPSNDDPDGKQAGSVKITIAHELKHAIQYAATKCEGESDLWSEMDATLMEEVVYDPVNDYYHYLDNPESIFNNPQSSFYPGTYYQVSWALYFEEKYGPEFWPSVWNIIKGEPDITFIEAISKQLGGEEAFNRAYIESQIWHYASGSRQSADSYGFAEGGRYPKSKSKPGNSFFSKNIRPPEADITNPLSSLSATHYTLNSPSKAEGKVGIEISASDKNSGTGIIAYFTDGTVETKIMAAADQQPEVIHTDWLWKKVSSIGIITTNRSTKKSADEPTVRIGNLDYDSFTVYQNYPNPFRRSTNIRFILEDDTPVTLKIYDITGRLVQTLVDEELEAGP